MAEFVEVMKNITKICKKNYCGDCILRNDDFCNGIPSELEEENFKEVEKIAMVY